MSQRLQVLFEEEELDEIRRFARSRQMTVAEWVRATLREARRNEPGTDVDTKLRCIEVAFQHDEGPPADIDQMLTEIDRGYLDNR